jgi:hypothetical protein
MNELMRSIETGEFYLIGVRMTVDGNYEVLSHFLLADGTIRARGGASVHKSERHAKNKVRSMIRTKKKREYVCVDMAWLPRRAVKYLQADLDKYVTPEEMKRMVAEAALERYVEFDCVTGIEDRFDEGVEYLALADTEEDEFYYVYDRNGVKCHCHKSRFSRLEPTERAVEVGVKEMLRWA